MYCVELEAYKKMYRLILSDNCSKVVYKRERGRSYVTISELVKWDAPLRCQIILYTAERRIKTLVLSA